MDLAELAFIDVAEALEEDIRRKRRQVTSAEAREAMEIQARKRYTGIP